MELLLKGDFWLFQRPAKTPCSCLFAHLILHPGCSPQPDPGPEAVKSLFFPREGS